jgi:hypothetical protein
MKRLLSLAILLGAAHLASAGTTNVYYENWGSNNTSVQNNALINVSTVGWIGAIAGGGANAGGAGGSNTAGPYFGAFNGGSPVDAATGSPLPANTVYFTAISSTNQSGPGMFYTTDTAGNGSVQTSPPFTDIIPANYTNLSFSVEVNGSATTATNYFAIEQGGTWYISTTPLTGSVGLSGSQFSNNILAYTSAGSAWNLLTTNATGVIIGPTVGGILFGPIQGIGIVELPTGGGWNYNQLAITAFAPNPPPPVPATIGSVPISQTVYAGGGAQFLMTAAGTQPITIVWETNGVPLANGSKYAGANTNMLTISNCQAGDATVTYSVSANNAYPPGQTNSSFTLTVNPLPAGTLYAESYPYIGVNGNLPLTGVGWSNASSPNTVVGIFQSGTGLGAVFDYSPSAGVNLNFTTDQNDTGFSGVPFVDINPASVPAVTLQAQFSPGNGAGTVSGAITAYWAVQMTGGLWYSSAKPIPTTLIQNNYLLDQLAFTTTATNWNTLTVNGGTVTIGGNPGGALSGNITGAGIIIVHNDTTGASMNWENFAITTNAVTQVKPTINGLVGLYNQSVPTGGGASFAVTTSAGALPITYSWSLNGVMLTNNSRISGANTPTLTIGNCTAADNDTPGTGNVIAYVSNSIGTDNSTFYTPISLFVTNAPIGELYTERFAYVGPSGNQAITLNGWTEGVPATPNVVFEVTSLTGEGAAFAFLGSPGTTVYYTTSSTDTNQAGVQFPGINPAFYSPLTFSVDLTPGFQATNVTCYLAVEFGANWYVSTAPFPVPGTGSDATYTTNFNGAAANWKQLTVTSVGGIVGPAATSNLKGVMDGAGLVFVTVNTGGTFNFDNFVINGPGLGGINAGALSGGSLPLSWVGNPAVNLQSSTSLTVPNWTDVPNTLGLYGQTVPASVPQKYYRLVAH